MKKIVYIGLVGMLLFSCKETIETGEWNVKFIEPSIKEGSTEVSLIPDLGFYTIRTASKDVCDFYCDTVNPPQKILFSLEQIYSRVPIEKRLLPSHTYYWKCVVYEGEGKDKRSVSSDVFSFTTIDLSTLYGKIWQLSDVWKYKNYVMNSEKEKWYSDVVNDAVTFGDIVRFQPIENTAFMVKRWALWGADLFPKQEPFAFTGDSVFIGERRFRFLNYGKDHLELEDPLHIVFGFVHYL
jgi:hypothetical protein